MLHYSYCDLLICLGEINRYFTGKRLSKILRNGKSHYFIFENTIQALHFFYGFPGYRLTLTDVIPDGLEEVLTDRYRSKLVKAKVYEGERILTLVFKKKSHSWAIIFELTGKHSNMVVINENGIITYVAKPIDRKLSRVRELLPGLKYVPPPVTGKRKILPPHYKEFCRDVEDRIEELQKGYIVYENSTPVMWTPVIPDGIKEYKEFTPFTNAIENFFRFQELRKKVENKEDILRKQLEKEMAKLKDFERYKEYAECLLQNFPPDYVFRENRINCGDFSIEVTPGSTCKEEVQRLYKLYKKYRRGYEKVRSMLEKGISKPVSIKEQGAEIEGEGKEGKNYREFISPGGYKVLVGKNASGNNYITFNLAKDNDLFFHVRDYAGAHVILKFSGLPFGEDDILFAAQKAAEYSKAGKGKVEVMYTERKNLYRHKGMPSGKVLLRKFKTIVVEKK